MFPVMTEPPSRHIWSDSLRTPKEKRPSGSPVLSASANQLA